MEFACSSPVFVHSLQVHQLPPTVQKYAISGDRLIDDSELPIGMNLCTNSYMSVCANSAPDLLHVQGIPTSWPMVPGLGSSPSVTVIRINTRGWMNGQNMDKWDSYRTI